MGLRKAVAAICLPPSFCLLLSCSTSLWAASIHCLPNSLLDNNTSYTATLLKESLRSLENLSNDNISWSFTTGNFTTSNSASLQHIGEFNDNYTRDRVILLQVGEGASQYRLSDNSSAPAFATATAATILTAHYLLFTSC